MNGVNKVILMGHLGKDPELTQTDDGKVCCRFSLATTEVYNKKKFTEWHNITVWGKMGNICSQYLKKGDPLYLEGRIKTSVRTDKETNEKKYYFSVQANSLNFINTRKGESSSDSDDMVDAAKKELGAQEEDDIPW